MTQFIDAIFEHGVFRPLGPVPFAEHEQVSLAVIRAVAAAENSTAAAESDEVARQRQLLAELRTELDSLPQVAPRDGLGGADHDIILYGESE